MDSIGRIGTIASALSEASLPQRPNYCVVAGHCAPIHWPVPEYFPFMGPFGLLAITWPVPCTCSASTAVNCITNCSVPMFRGIQVPLACMELPVELITFQLQFAFGSVNGYFVRSPGRTHDV